MVTWYFPSVLANKSHMNDPVNSWWVHWLCPPNSWIRRSYFSLVQTLTNILMNWVYKCDPQRIGPSIGPQLTCTVSYTCNKRQFILRYLWHVNFTSPRWGYTRLWRPLYHKFHFLLSVYTHLCHFLSRSYVWHEGAWSFMELLTRGFFHGWRKDVMELNESLLS